ncbi:hypothetical protein ARTHRO_41283 [Limnospira indica PCC 8005]|uniref:Uncharacterized protein n=1 Tax=Limnospira indica PCC 8005 TaxID=376219 RepID=A0A9P1P0T6_9CYAN|nr:hypothetical protein ARTHRO_41283 [Limnospira indica PCC 8005]
MPLYVLTSLSCNLSIPYILPRGRNPTGTLFRALQPYLVSQTFRTVMILCTVVRVMTLFSVVMVMMCCLEMRVMIL